jgi:dihydrofolate reductase
LTLVGFSCVFPFFPLFIQTLGVSGASVVRQCLEAGLLDEIYIDLVPVLLGAGIRLFEGLGTGPIELERTRLVAGSGVTHLHFRVRR